MIVKDGVGGKERWAEQTLRPFTKKAPARKPTFETTSGIPFEDLYTPEDLADTFLFLASDGSAALTGQCLSPSHGEVML